MPPLVVLIRWDTLTLGVIRSVLPPCVLNTAVTAQELDTVSTDWAAEDTVGRSNAPSFAVIATVGARVNKSRGLAVL
jgi:hypothetical protein